MILARDILTAADMQEAREVGLAHFQRAKSNGFAQPYGDPGDDKRVYIDCWSALAECAVARWLDLPWHYGLDDDLSVKPVDVGTRIEVRWTHHRSGHLLGHDTDPDGRIMVLVTQELPEMTIKGWTVAQAVKQEKYLRFTPERNSSSYWFPPHLLLMTELMEQMQGL